MFDKSKIDKILEEPNDNKNTPSHKSVLEENIVAGLDIGSTKVACVVGRKTADGKINILGYGESVSEGLECGAITDMSSAIESISSAVKRASIRSNVEIHNVVLGITVQTISIQHHSTYRRNDPSTETTAEEVDKLREEAYKIKIQPDEEIIDVIPQDVFIDRNPVKNPVGLLGSKLEADFLVITTKQSIKNLIKCVEKAGFEVGKVTLSSIASSQAVLTEEEKNIGVALVDIGGGTTGLTIFHKNKLYHTASIPMGGELITKDIMTGCGIIHKYAEDIKVKYGSALESKNRADELVSIPGINGDRPKEISFTKLAGIIKARLTEIFFAVNSQLRIHKELPLNGGIVLTGGCSQTKDIASLMKSIVSVDILMKYIPRIDVRIGSPIFDERFTCDESIKDTLSNPAMSACVGLLLESGIGNMRKITDRALKEVERERTEQSKKEKVTKESKAQPQRNTSSSFLNIFRKKIKSLIFFLKNEWEPKFIGGRIAITEYKNKYKIVVYSTIDKDYITVWVKTGHKIKSAAWDGRKLELSISLGDSIILWGPNGHKWDYN